MVPGLDERLLILKKQRVAREIGFPILIKASAGGGKGMRVVENEESLNPK
jgi:acetyl/propionyl-CoA carboxylase alpha subunit